MKRQLTYFEKRYGIVFSSKPLWYEVNVYQDFDPALDRCFKRGNYAQNYANKLVSQNIWCEIDAILTDGTVMQICCC